MLGLKNIRKMSRTDRLPIHKNHVVVQIVVFFFCYPIISFGIFDIDYLIYMS